ncbi:winged helix-turn-helix transcriptional regulator [Sulfitobacter pontiacus]|uniref:winged helix-turn-helix transcriptional regulator n=1 Tax=Sulfitobacter pontiacus TaxID=60137 RepID=UPI00295EC991|nr:winged helix-turn-helix transcriptional regulator [Sulfitobacter pontiacus]
MLNTYLQFARCPLGSPCAVDWGSSILSSARAMMREYKYFHALSLSQMNPEISQRELAAAVGLSVWGVHYLLNAFIEKGLVKLANFCGGMGQEAVCINYNAPGHHRKVITHE